MEEDEDGNDKNDNEEDLIVDSVMEHWLGSGRIWWSHWMQGIAAVRVNRFKAVLMLVVSCWILLKTRESRELLQKYTRDRKCAWNPKQLTRSELKRLQTLLAREGASSLEVITRLSQHAHVRIVPPPYHTTNYSLNCHSTLQYVVYYK